MIDKVISELKDAETYGDQGNGGVFRPIAEENNMQDE
jgi:hypothetical protein